MNPKSNEQNVVVPARIMKAARGYATSRAKMIAATSRGSRRSVDEMTASIQAMKSSAERLFMAIQVDCAKAMSQQRDELRRRGIIPDNVPPAKDEPK